MATKTISIDEEAYRILYFEKLALTESFSKVIKRAKFEKPRKTLAALSVTLKELPPLNLEDIERWDDLEDRHPDDPWQN